MKHLSRAPATGMPGPITPSLTPRAFAVAVGLALTLGQAVAVEESNLRFDSTRDLHAVCSVPASAAEHIVAHQACRAFIEGVAQYHDLISKPGKMKRLYCMPKGSTVEDGLAAFNAWAAAESSDAKLMGEEPALGLVRALAAKYPCKG
ncbi:MAG: Rap1a/Tai family immunity protein [Bdellovibrio bacteriovorus]